MEQLFFKAYLQVNAPACPEKSALLESALPTPVQKNIFSYTVNTDQAGFVQQPDKIVVRYAHTIYPYSFARNIDIGTKKLS